MIHFITLTRSWYDPKTMYVPEHYDIAINHIVGMIDHRHVKLEPQESTQVLLTCPSYTDVWVKETPEEIKALICQHSQ